jgi:hypothetical protein
MFKNIFRNYHKLKPIQNNTISLKINNKQHELYRLLTSIGVWLRDHCRCSQCFHPITKQRLMDTFSIPLDIQPLKTEISNTNLKITCI